jgi:hypothetical protein
MSSSPEAPEPGAAESDASAWEPEPDLPGADRDAQHWPRPAHNNTAQLDAKYDAQLDVRKKRVDAEIERTKLERSAEIDILQGFAETYRDIAKGAIQRARDGADAVMKASAAVATVYTGVLGFVFAADGKPLPTRGIVAPLFLGAAVVLATAYLAFLRADSGTVDKPGARALEQKVVLWGNALAQIARSIAYRRAFTMRAAVLALGVGLACLPLPFIQVGSPGTQDDGPVAFWSVLIGAVITIGGADISDPPSRLRRLWKRGFGWTSRLFRRGS